MPAPLLIVTATAKEQQSLCLAAAADMVPCVTGVGIINAALVLGQELAGRDVAGVINFGLAGSFDLAALPLGTICVVEREIWPEYGLGTDSGVDAKALKFPLNKLDGQPVWDRLELTPERAAKAMNLPLPATWHRATSLTVSTVSATQQRACDLQSSHAAQLENMEGFALAYACALAGVPFLEIRTVSNLVGSRNPSDWDFAAGFTALAAAAETLVPRLDGKGNDG